MAGLVLVAIFVTVGLAWYHESKIEKREKRKADFVRRWIEYSEEME